MLRFVLTIEIMSQLLTTIQPTTFVLQTPAAITTGFRLCCNFVVINTMYGC